MNFFKYCDDFRILRRINSKNSSKNFWLRFGAAQHSTITAVVNLSDDRITDVSSLRSLTQLSVVDLQGNPIVSNFCIAIAPIRAKIEIIPSEKHDTTSDRSVEMSVNTTSCLEKLLYKCKDYKEAFLGILDVER
jgi:Leucine-rich repeat (LRR) protein